MTADYTDEMLMRFADGELDPETSAEIEQAMATDEELVTRVALFTETRLAAQAAMRPLLDEPVPAALTAAVEKMIAEHGAAETAPESTVLPFPRRAAADERPWLMPIAASLAALLAGIGGYWLGAGGDGAPGNGLEVAGIGSPALGEALASVPSGEEIELHGSDQRFRAIATFHNSDRALCREFEVDSPDRSTVVSVACRSGTEWHVTFAVVALGEIDGYAPASSTEALDAYLGAIEAGPPMEAAEESQALEILRREGQN